MSLSSLGVLTLQGDATTPNTLVVSLNSAGNILASANGATKTYSPIAVKSIRLIGGSASDNLHALQGVKAPVYADGGAGDDSILGGAGNDTLLGGVGNDSLSGSDGHDLLKGSDGNDLINGDAGDDSLYGEAGNDTLVGGAGTNVSDGGEGINTLDGVTGGTPAASPTAVLLTGATQGTAGSWNNSGATAAKVFDANPATYFDAPQSLAWAGLDLTTAHTITSVRFHPRAGLAWRMVGGSFQGSNDGANWTTLATLAAEPAEGQYTTVNITNSNTYRYVRYLAPAGGYGNVAEVEFYGIAVATTPVKEPQQPAVTGKVTGVNFGTAGSWAGSGSTFDKAVDGNVETFFDAAQGSGNVVGLDFGTAKVITSVKYWPRTGLGWRMVGGTFEGSNDGTNWTTLGTITQTPPDGAFSTLSVSVPTPFRYVRYASPLQSFGNVAEIEFYGSDPVSSPASPDAVVVGPSVPSAPGGVTTSFARTGGVTVSWTDTSENETGFKIERSAAGGAWEVVGHIGANGTAYTDTTVASGTTYAYRVRATSDAGDSAASASATITTPVVVAGAPVVHIAAMGTEITAGMAVQMHALQSVLNSGTPAGARYEWDFGDPNGAYNKLSGFNASHVYANPGTYTVTLTVTDDQGRVGTQSTTVTVAADSRKTIHVDAVSGSDSNNGLSSSGAVRSAARAFQLAGDNTRVLFNRGGTYEITWSLMAGYKNFLVGAYGEGDKPVIRWAGGPEVWWEMISGTSASRDVVVRDLAFDGGATHLTGVAPRGVNFAVIGCEFRTMQISINCAGNPMGLLVQDNVQPTDSGVSDYWLWLQGTDAVVVGNNVGADGMYAVRTSGGTGQTVERALFAQNVFANADRSNLRVQKGSYVYVANNTFVWSGVEFGPLGGGDGKNDPNWATAHTSWVVFENNRVSLGDGKYVRLTSGLEHVAVRNNVIEHNGGVGSAAISIEGYDAAYGRIVADATIANNTIIEKGNQGIAIKLQGPENGPQISVLNNVLVAPNLVAAASTGSAAIWVADGTMGSFRVVSGNVWGIAKWESYVGPQGFVYVTGGSNTGFLTPAMWEAYSNVEGDVFQSVTLGDVYQVTVGGVTAGANLVRV